MCKGGIGDTVFSLKTYGHVHSSVSMRPGQRSHVVFFKLHS